MSASAKLERNVLSHDEYEIVRTTHHPEIYDVDDLKKLQELQARLRAFRSKEQTLLRQKRREARGKTEARGKSFPGTAEQPQKRKQIFAAALKRTNNEIRRVRALEARAQNIEAAHKALALRKDGFIVHRPQERTAHEGMRPVPSTRRRSHVPGSKIGSISQATKVAQAIKDARTA